MNIRIPDWSRLVASSGGVGCAIVLAGALAGCSLPWQSSGTSSRSGPLLDQSGTDSIQRTSNFDAPLYWNLQNAWNCQKAPAIRSTQRSFVDFEVMVKDAGTNAVVDSVKFQFDPAIHNYVDTGTKHINTAGKFYLQISSLPGCTWHVVAR